MRPCGIIAPRQEKVVDVDMIIAGVENYLAECILPSHHTGPHLIKIPTGRYIAWETDWECGCDDCKSHDANDRCVLYWDVKGKDLQKLLQGRSG